MTKLGYIVSALLFLAAITISVVTDGKSPAVLFTLVMCYLCFALSVISQSKTWFRS